MGTKASSEEGLSELGLEEFLETFAVTQREQRPPRFRKKKVIIIAGPTAVGKTRVSLMVAKELGGQVISADSVQVYKGMDIGTAKVLPSERGDIPHFLIDLHDLCEPFNIMHFYKETARLIAEILDRGGVPIIVGGTGFYLNALLYGPPEGPPSDPETRAAFEKEFDLLGADALYARLQILDPVYAASVTKNDRQKIVRALEIIKLSERPVSFFAKKSKGLLENYNFRCWFLHMPREYLNMEIEKRCDKMLADGLIEETIQLKEKGLTSNRSASQAIGYRQCLTYLESDKGKEAKSGLVTSFKKASRDYAKRQFTWFKNKDRDKLFQWINVLGLSPAEVAEYIMHDYELSL